MKKLALVLILGLVAATTVLAASKATVWQGTLVDVNCYLKDHSLTGNDHMGVKECGTMCLKSGLPAGLLTQNNQLHILVAPSTPLAPYVGQQVRVSGSMQSGAIQTEKVEVQKNGKWVNIQLNSMM